MLTALLYLALQVAPPKGPPDWKVEVLAEVPKIKHPSVCCFAPDGRLFVGEDPMDMGLPSHLPADRILCFHPDGRVTVFAEGLYAVFGLQYLDGRLFVHHTPRFSVFTDGGDAGRDRVDLIECTNPAPSLNGGGFNDHIPSNCRMAMDGWLYVSTGDKGIYGAVGRDGSKIEIRGGGIFRMRPDGTRLEVYCTGTRNHLDVALNAEDEMFTYDNTDDGLGWWTRATHMVDGGFYGYPWDYKPRRPYTLWMMADYGGGSGCASIAYNGDALPAEYHGNLFLSDWARKEVLRLVVAREGATYRIVSTEKFLKQDGPGEFRPLGLAWSPDGMSLTVCDWNFGGWKQDKVAGRLIRATYTGKSAAAPTPAWLVPAATTKPFEASNDDLVRALSHSDQAVRLVAQRRLAERKVALDGVLTDPKAPAHAKWHAIWAMEGNATTALKDPEASVRRQAARQLGARKAKEAVDPLLGLLKDADASVRFQAATALGRIGDPRSVPALLAALDEKDLFARYAAFSALNRIGRADGSAWAAILKGLDGPPAVREGTFFALRETYDEALVRALQAAPRTPESLAALAELHRKPPAWNGKWWGTQPANQPRPAKTVEYAGTPIVLETLRAALADSAPAVRRAAVEGFGVAKDLTAASTLRDLFAKETDPDVRRAVLRTLGALKDAASSDLIAGAIKDAALRADAVAAAEQVGGPKVVTALIELVSVGPEPIEALGRLKAREAAPAIAKQISNADAKIALAAVTALGQVGADAALLPALEDKRVEVRRAALGIVRSKDAVPAMLRAYLDPETRFEAIAALAGVPDLRALDAYLEGLGGKNATVRDACRKALAALHAEALPKIEARIDQQALSAEVIGELQRLYNKTAPIVDWAILGPFANDPKVAPPFPPEAPALDRELKDVEGKPAAWKKAKVKNEHGAVDLHAAMSVKENVMVYGVAEIVSAAERQTDFMAGSDDSLEVWLNGQKVFEDLHDHGWKEDQFHFRGTLRAGKNALLIRCGNHGDGYMFSVAYSPERRGKLFEAASKKLDPKAYADFAMKQKGDPARGRALFADAKGVACVKCHKVDGQGGEVGPELTGVGAKYARAILVESVLYPSKQILDGYKQELVLTKDGDLKSGRFLGETADELTLIDAEGKRLAVKKPSIEQRKTSDLSLMPEGLNTGLSLQDFADLVSFLETLKEPAKK